MSNDNDRVFPSLDAKELEIRTLDLLLKQGVHYGYIYAHRKTDRLVTKANWELLDDEAKAEWTDACDEWIAMSKRDQKAWRRALEIEIAAHQSKAATKH